MTNVVPIRPAEDIPAMLRKLADRIEAEGNVEDVFLVLVPDDGTDHEVYGYGPCCDPFHIAGVFTKTARDVLP